MFLRSLQIIEGRLLRTDIKYQSSSLFPFIRSRTPFIFSTKMSGNPLWRRSKDTFGPFIFITSRPSYFVPWNVGQPKPYWVVGGHSQCPFILRIVFPRRKVEVFGPICQINLKCDQIVWGAVTVFRSLFQKREKEKSNVQNPWFYTISRYWVNLTIYLSSPVLVILSGSCGKFCRKTWNHHSTFC